MKDLRQYLRPGQTFSPEDFRTPPSCFAVQYAWAWYSPVSLEGIRQKILRMAEAGIRGFYILPQPKEFRPNTMKTEMEPDYLTDEYFRASRYAAEVAAEQGMTCWLYDEGGWPSGGACGKVVEALPSAARKALGEHTVSLRAGEAYTPSENALAAYVDRRRIAAGTCFSADTEVQEVTLEVISRHYIDFYDPAAIAKFTELTHEGYARTFGDALRDIPLMFTDEPSGSATAFSPELPALFREKYGYDLLDYLPALLHPETMNAQEYQARLDYAHLQKERFLASMDSLREATHRCGMLLGGHLDNDHAALGCVTNGYADTLRGLKTMDVPGVDVIWQHIGADGSTQGSCFFPRLASSAAAQQGTNLALSESCGVYGSSLTPDAIRYIVNYQLVRGINLFNLMLMPYSMERAYGYRERPNFHEDMPGFYHLRALNDEIARESYFMSHGNPVAKDALFIPCDDFYRETETAKTFADAYDALGKELEARQIEFDVIDAETILSGTVQDGLLHCGSGVYGKVWLPEGVTVPEKIAELLKTLRGSVSSPVSVTSPALQARVRQDADGALYICLFNQSTAPETFRTRVQTALPLYRMDPKDGTILPFVQDEACTLPSGACLLLYAGKLTHFDTAHRYGEPQALTCEAVIQTQELFADATGVYQEPRHEVHAPAESFAELFGEGFSGEAEYVFPFRWDAPGAALLEIQRLEYSAKVFLNGKSVGTVSTTPHRLHIPAEFFRPGENRLVISVANLAANVYARTPAEEFFPPVWLGPYHEKSRNYEKQIGGGGLFGEVALRREI